MLAISIRANPPASPRDQHPRANEATRFPHRNGWGESRRGAEASAVPQQKSRLPLRRGFQAREIRHEILSLAKGIFMKTHTEYLKFHTRQHREYIHITPQIEAIVNKSGIKEGMVLVSAMHITAGVYVNDNESGLIEDIDQWLEHLAPYRDDYRHHDTGETNGDSHLKALLIHHEVIVPITAGKLDFGPWQRIFYAEFDGQRSKRVIVKVMGE